MNRLQRLLRTHLTVLFFLALSLASLAKAKTLGEISVEGVSQKNAMAVRETIQKFIHRSFSLEDVERAMAAVYNTGVFNGIDVFFDEREDITDVIFRFAAVKTVKTINLVGNHHFNSLDLLNEMSFSEGESLSQEKIQTAVDNVKKFYNLNGYLNAQVSAEVIGVENSADVSANVKITEGEPCRITEFSFKSVNESLNKDLSKLLKKYTGKIFTQALLTEMQKALTDSLFQDRYYTAQAQAPEMSYNALKTAVKIAYVVNDPYVFALVFEGNENYNAARLMKELKLDPDNRLSNSPVEDLTERLLRFYKKEGFANVTIKHTENLFAQDFIRRLTFTINEGPKVHIKDILFEGTFSKPVKFYRDFIYDHSGDEVSSKIYNGEDIDNGVKNLVTELQNQGFISAKIPSVRTDFDKTRSFVTMRINLEEGPQTFIEKIIFKGLKNSTPAEIETTIDLQQGAPLQLNRLEEAPTKIVEFFRAKGYLDVQVTNQGKSVITYSQDNTKAQIVFEIKEGPLVTVGSIVVDGNATTKDYVVTRELQFHQGEVLTPEKINYSEQRLQRLSIFTSVEIRTLTDDPNEGRRTVLVHVVEHDPGSFKTGIGVNNDLGLSLKGFVGTAYRNLFGTGRAINGRVEVNDIINYNFYEFDVNMGYTEPFIFGTNNTGRINLIDSRHLFSIDPTTNLTTAADTIQGDFFLERDITRRLKLVYDVYGIARTNTFDINNLGPTTPYLISTTGPTFIYDARNNQFNPSTGSISTYSLEFSSPYMGSTQTVSYYKTILGHRQYFPLAQKLILATEGRGGYLRNLSTLADGAVPPIKDFVLGGRSTIRGFNPATESIPLPSDYPNGMQTEEYFVLAKSEIRFPIIGELGGALFYDGGQVAFPGYNPQFRWRDAVGTGIRYDTPVGPLSLDLGCKLNRDDTRGESECQLDFSIGNF